MSTRLKEISLSNGFDISELISLEDQKLCCEKMLDEILDAEDILNTRLTGIQTINDAIQSDQQLINSLSEFLGYHYGRMSTSRGMVNVALVNLNRFMEGGLDNIDHGARGMYLNVWYNLGVSGLVDIEECLVDLEQMEAEIVEVASKNGNIRPETLH